MQIPLPKEHVHIPFLTQITVFVGNLGFQSISERYERPCTILKHVGKTNFYLVPTWLLGTTRLLNSKKLSHLHAYLELTLIRDLRVLLFTYNKGAFKNYVDHFLSYFDPLPTSG